MSKIPYNFHTIALRSLADDLMVSDPRWEPIVNILRDAADELETRQDGRAYYHKDRRYDPDFGDDKVCKCGHPYHRHFDSYENMEPIGCKYCECEGFEEATNDQVCDK